MIDVADASYITRISNTKCNITYPFVSGGKYLVFFFYPLAFTFVCPTEILAFNDRVEEFRAIGAEVVGCSVDSHFASLAWMNTPRAEGGLGTLDIPLLSDLTHKISKDYGVYLEDNGISLRGLFINPLLLIIDLGVGWTSLC